MNYFPNLCGYKYIGRYTFFLRELHRNMDAYKPRKRLYIFDGTWTHRNGSSKTTIPAAVIDLFAQSRDIEVYYSGGVGTRCGLIEKYIGGDNDPLHCYCSLPTNKSIQAVLVVIKSRGKFLTRSMTSPRIIAKAMRLLLSGTVEVRPPCSPSRHYY